jgi:hypothetical protein
MNAGLGSYIFIGIVIYVFYKLFIDDCGGGSCGSDPYHDDDGLGGYGSFDSDYDDGGFSGPDFF